MTSFSRFNELILNILFRIFLSKCNEFFLETKQLNYLNNEFIVNILFRNFSWNVTIFFSKRNNVVLENTYMMQTKTFILDAINRLTALIRR